ncbi:hypothetical protein GW17_00031237 [Ensete ventricosum]|nr:hypothetical protein GW17_00031237 [Ensete ventricosum]
MIRLCSWWRQAESCTPGVRPSCRSLNLLLPVARHVGDTSAGASGRWAICLATDGQSREACWWRTTSRESFPSLERIPRMDGEGEKNTSRPRHPLPLSFRFVEDREEEKFGRTRRRNTESGKGESILGKGGRERDGGVRGEAIQNPHSHSDPGKGVLRRSTLLCLPLIRGGFWCFVGQAACLIKTEFEPKPNVPDKFVLSDPPIGLFDPIEISPAVVPRNSYPVEPLSPMYPSFPSTYEPVLTGRCPVNFSSLSDIIDKTASDCSAPLAALVGNVICCPQVNSLMHIFQGVYSSESDMLVLQQATANYCFSDLINILASRGANSRIPTLCPVKSSNLTGGSCPVNDLVTFEKIVNTSKLLDSCSTVDPLKECCRPICQPAIVEAAFQISLRRASMLDSSRTPGSTAGITVVNDCKGVVYAWLSRKLSSEAANTGYRILSGCKLQAICISDNQGSPYRFVPAYQDLAGTVWVCSLYRLVQGGPRTGKSSDRYISPVLGDTGRYGKPW